MSRERELLERALDKWIIGSDEDVQRVMDEIGEFLAKPEVKREAAPKTMQKECPYAGGILRASFYEGWMEAERHHGIGDNNENTNH